MVRAESSGEQLRSTARGELSKLKTCDLALHRTKQRPSRWLCSRQSAVDEREPSTKSAAPAERLSRCGTSNKSWTLEVGS